MKTNLWGSQAWTFLHAVTFAYPENPSLEKRESARDLFRSLRHVLPCEECCGHYCSEFDKDPVDNHLDSKKALSMWLVNFHNKVNERLGKKKFSYDEAVELFDHETCDIESCVEPEKKTNLLPLVCLLALLLFVVMKNKWMISKLFMK